MDRFSYRPTIKTLPEFPDYKEEKILIKVQAAFIQAEEHDPEQGKAIEKKVLKNLKWIAGKNQTKKIILHSFAHLSESKAEPAFTKKFLDTIEERLIHTGYEVYQTPFGYFLDLELNAPGHSLARVFKSF